MNKTYTSVAKITLNQKYNDLEFDSDENQAEFIIANGKIVMIFFDEGIEDFRETQKKAEIFFLNEEFVVVRKSTLNALAKDFVQKIEVPWEMAGYCSTTAENIEIEKREISNFFSINLNQGIKCL